MAPSAASYEREGLDERFVRSVRFAMRAYPRRWRAAQGEELCGLVIDLAAPGTQRLGSRGAFDLVRGGLATRWRGHPPVLPWLGYRLFNRRIPVAFRAWALDDIEGFLYPVRQLELVLWFLVPQFLLGQGEHDRAYRHGFVWLVILVALGSIAWSKDVRRAYVIKHVVPRQGERLVAGDLMVHEAPQPQLPARAALPLFVWILSLTGATSVVTALLAPKALVFIGPDSTHSSQIIVGPVGEGRIVAGVFLMVALGIGMLGAAVANRRLASLLEKRPDQPHRTLVEATAEDRAVLILRIATIAGVAWLELSGRLVLGPSIVLGVAALILLPGALIALAAIRHPSNADLAGSDLWSIAAFGETPGVDQPAFELRPLAGPVPEGAVAAGARWPMDNQTYPAMP